MVLDTDDAIDRLAEAVVTCSLPIEHWTHESHFALALWLVRHKKLWSSPTQIRWIIMRYNQSVGTANTARSGYHHTITLASIRAATHFHRKFDAKSALAPILSALMQSKFGQSRWTTEYWSEPVLMSTRARRQWVDPDRRRLDF